NPPKTEFDRVAGFGFFAQGICLKTPEPDPKLPYLHTANHKLMVAVSTLNQSHRAVHPGAGTRIDSVLLQNPQVGDALRCVSTNGNRCFERSRAPRRDTPAAGSQ
ncbi:MAG TPA: hypothetical protein VFV50_05485, partial [Bdellovibrionales bacterium]|nr:hypothetical protein [Bdellovibrionales bacterium]